jgi:hypothetical protein
LGFVAEAVAIAVGLNNGGDIELGARGRAEVRIGAAGRRIRIQQHVSRVAAGNVPQYLSGVRVVVEPEHVPLFDRDAHVGVGIELIQHRTLEGALADDCEVVAACGSRDLEPDKQHRVCRGLKAPGRDHAGERRAVLAGRRNRLQVGPLRDTHVGHEGLPDMGSRARDGRS